MPEPQTQIRWFANDKMKLVVDTQTLAGQIVDHDSGEGWRFDLLKHLRASQQNQANIPCRLTTVSDSALGAGGVEAHAQIGENTYRFAVWLETGTAEVLFELEPLEEPAQLGDVVFPGPLLPTRGPVTQLVLPSIRTNGVVHLPRPDDHWTQTLNVSSHAGLNMPFWGLESATTNVLVIVETADDFKLTLEKSIREPLQVATLWTASLGRVRYPRRVRVRVLNTGGYVAMAKAYRAYIKDRGRFKSFAQKIEERPTVRQIIGGPYFFLGYLPFSERKFRQIVHGLRDIGYTNGIIGPINNIQWDSGDWLNDYQPFINAPQYGRIAAEAGFAAFSWLWMEDILPWDRYFDPSWIMRAEDGKTIKSWINRDYEYQPICTKVLKEKHILLREELMQFDALHFDRTTATPLRECWHPDHIMSRSEDRENRRARLAEVASWGKLVGSEAGYDWAFDLYDYCSSNPRRALETGLPVAAEHVPLLGLVYHDSVVSYYWEFEPYNRSSFGGRDWAAEKLLHDVMAGNPPTISPVLGYFPIPVARTPASPVEAYWLTWEDEATRKILRDALPVAQLHGRTAQHELIDHAFIGEDRKVTRTVYGDGTYVLVNFSPEAREVESGIVLQPRSYQIR